MRQKGTEAMRPGKRGSWHFRWGRGSSGSAVGPRGLASVLFLRKTKDAGPKTEETPSWGGPHPLFRRQRTPSLAPGLGIHHSLPPRLREGHLGSGDSAGAALRQAWWEPGLDGPGDA